MQNHPTPALEQLARARENHSVVAEKLEDATRTNTALLVRLTEAQARSAEALRLTRANGDADGKHAMAMKVADEDAKDIQVLINQSQSQVAALTQAEIQAKSLLMKAQTAASSEENEIQAKELDAIIRELDVKLCEAVHRRLVCHLASNPREGSKNSCFKFYEASPMLRNIVSRSLVAA